MYCVCAVFLNVIKYFAISNFLGTASNFWNLLKKFSQKRDIIWVVYLRCVHTTTLAFLVKPIDINNLYSVDKLSGRSYQWASWAGGCDNLIRLLSVLILESCRGNSNVDNASCNVDVVNFAQLLLALSVYQHQDSIVWTHLYQ